MQRKGQLAQEKKIIIHVIKCGQTSLPTLIDSYKPNEERQSRESDFQLYRPCPLNNVP